MKPLLIALAVITTACGAAEETPQKEDDVAIAVSSLSEVHRGTNTFSLTIDHPDATRVEAVPWMPSMGHGAPSEPSVIKESDTTYRVENVMFSMAGTWELRVAVTCPHGQATRAFRYEVP